MLPKAQLSHVAPAVKPARFTHPIAPFAARQKGVAVFLHRLYLPESVVMHIEDCCDLGRRNDSHLVILLSSGLMFIKALALASYFSGKRVLRSTVIRNRSLLQNSTVSFQPPR